jgi:imidazolonepropionase-like amidohydrolase
MAGPSFGIKAAIDSGVIPGPRVYPSGALISQTAGHGDFAPPYARPFTIGGRPSHLEEIGEFAVVNGVPEVLAAVRDQLKKGASQIKLAVGGGVISDFDPIDSLQFTPQEIRTAVQAAKDWGPMLQLMSTRLREYAGLLMPGCNRLNTVISRMNRR